MAARRAPAACCAACETPWTAPAPAGDRLCSFFRWVEESGTKLVEVPLRPGADGGWRLDLDALADAFAAGPSVYVLCNPPTRSDGCTPARSWMRWCGSRTEYNVTVLSDEIHAPLLLSGATFTPFLTVPGAGELGLSLLSAIAAFEFGGEWLDALLATLDQRRRQLSTLLGHRLPDERWRHRRGPVRHGWTAERTGGADPRDLFLHRGRVAL